MNFINVTIRQAVIYSREQSFVQWRLAALFILTLLINSAFGYTFNALDALGVFCFFMFLNNLSAKAFKCSLFAFSLLAACYFPFAQTYGAPNFNSILSLYSSNPEEAGEILQVFPVWFYLVSALMLLLAIALIRMPVSSAPLRSTKSAALGSIFLLCSLISPINHLSDKGGFSLLNISFPAFRFVKDVTLINMNVHSEHERMQKLSNLQDDWHVVAVKPKHQLYVVVIGESARRDALGAFGGVWDNTPFMSKAPGVLFQNYLSAASSTQQSLGLTLSFVGKDQQPQYQNNIVTLAKRAGFKTYWFSNQGQIGNYDTVIASIAKRSDTTQFLKHGNFFSENTQDADLLKFTSDAVNENTNTPKLIVYHLIGSHPKACERTNNHYETFVHNKEISCYIYSIKQTDQFLATLNEQLKSSGQSFSMIYFSDHGLAFNERGTKSEYLSHNDQYKQNYQVPFFMTSSGDTRQRKIKTARSANDFLSLFTEWSGIQSMEIQPQYRFISEQVAPAIYVTNFEPKRIDYRQLPQDPFVSGVTDPSQTTMHINQLATHRN